MKFFKELFKKRSWGKWQDVTVIRSSGSWVLLQVSTCELTGAKRYARREMGWINDYICLSDIQKKTNISE